VRQLQIKVELVLEQERKGLIQRQLEEEEKEF
jgi:hypothetical protein